MSPEKTPPLVEVAETDLPDIVDNQEAINAEILERLRGLVPLELEESKMMTETMLVSRLDIEVYDLQAIFSAMGIEPKRVGTGQLRRYAYTAKAIDRLNAEIEYQNTGKIVGTSRIAKTIGRSVAWTKQLIAEAGVEPHHHVEINGRQVPKYGAYVIGLVADYDKENYPPADDWFNYYQLIDLFGEDRSWIKARLDEAGIQPQNRRNMDTGKTLAYFPPSSLDVLNSAKDNRPAAAQPDWLTAEAVERHLGKSPNWIRARLDAYADDAKLMLDSRQTPRWHYPPGTLDGLRQELAELESIPKANGYLSLSDLARELGKSRLWVSNRIARYQPLGEQRRDKKDQINIRYPRSVLDALKQEVDYALSYPEAGPNLTLSELAEALDTTTQTLHKSLDKHNIKGVLCRDKLGKVRPHYPPKTVELLKTVQ